MQKLILSCWKIRLACWMMQMSGFKIQNLLFSPLADSTIAVLAWIPWILSQHQRSSVFCRRANCFHHSSICVEQSVLHLCATTEQHGVEWKLMNVKFIVILTFFSHCRKMLSWLYGIYFWFSLLYLIMRTLAVSLFSAEINDKSKRPVEVLRAIPRESWCLDVSQDPL